MNNYSRRSLPLFFAAALALLGVAAATASACSCASDPARQFRSADAAVTARLLRVVDRPGAPAVYRYRVRRVFKGPARLDRGDVIRVVNEIGATCSLPRRKDRVYGLFLDRRAGRWTAGLCDVTTPRRMRAAAAGTAAGSSGCAPPSTR